MYAWGDAFLWATSRYETGYPQTFTVLDPARVVVEADPRGGRLYRIDQDYLPADDVVQITRDPRGALRGTSALEGYGGNVASAAAAEAHAAETFANGGIPWAVLQPSQRLNAEQAAELQGQWMARAAARGQAPAVIPPDVAYKEFAFNPKDLMLLETREWDAKQIAAAFGVPAFMLNMEQAGGLNYSNPQQLFATWWRSELYPACRRVEEHLSKWLPRGSWVEFDPSALLSPDVVGRQAVASKALSDGAMSLNEYRAYVFDLPPLEEGEALELLDEPPGASPSFAQPAPTPPALEVVAQ
jgi:HK97 family phage portal protein